MIRIYPEQLKSQLEIQLQTCYLLFGNNLLLLQESQDLILAKAKTQRFNECFSMLLDASADWGTLFKKCYDRSLFSTNQIILLILPDNVSYNNIGHNLNTITSLCNKDILLILRGTKHIPYAEERKGWLKNLGDNAVLVSCIMPEYNELPGWVNNRANNMHLILDNEACQLLCYTYEGNLLGLIQVLEMLSIIYPDGYLTLSRVQYVVNNKAAYFTPLHWVDAVLNCNYRRAYHILSQLQLQHSDLVVIILLRLIQREVMLLLIIKRQLGTLGIKILLSKYNVCHSRRKQLLTQALKRLSLPDLHQAIMLMTKIELAIKEENGFLNNVWYDLNTLSLLLCNKKLSRVIIMHD